MDIKKIAINHWPISILNGFSAFLSLALPMLMSRYIPGEEIGKYKIILLYVMMAPALSMSSGIDNGIYYWAGLIYNSKEKIRAAWSMAVIQSFGFFVILMLFSPVIKVWLNLNWNQYISFSVASLTVTLSSLYESILIARKKIWSGAIFSAFFNGINTIAIFIAIFLFKSAVIIVWAYIIAQTIKILTSYYMGIKDGWIPILLDLKEAKNVRQYYMPISASGIFNFLQNNSDRFFLSILISPIKYASYSFGCLSIPPLQILETSVNRIMIPQLAIAINKNDKIHAANIYRSGVEQVMLIFIPAFVGLLIFAEPIIRLLFTDKYIDAVSYLRIYSLWILLSGIPHDVAARASGNSKWILKNNITMGTFSLVLCSALAWKFGPYGALFAMIITLSIQKYTGFKLMINNHGWSLNEMIPFKTLFLYFSLAGFLGGISLLLINTFPSNIAWFIYCSIPFALIYLGVVFFIRKDIFGDLFFVKKIFGKIFKLSYVG